MSCWLVGRSVIFFSKLGSRKVTLPALLSEHLLLSQDEPEDVVEVLGEDETWETIDLDQVTTSSVRQWALSELTVISDGRTK